MKTYILRMLRVPRILLLCLIASPLLFSVSSFADTNKIVTENQKIEIPDYAKVFSTEATFEDAKDDLLEAISSNGLVISYTSHAKTMLDNTAEVSGVEKSVYADAEILLFCKADLSHKLVAENPHNIVLCPYSIAIYVLSTEPDTVYLSYRSVEIGDDKIKALTKPIEELLIKIIEEVI